MTAPHPDTETLSAHLDGVRDAHVESCAECGAQLERLAGARRAVASLPASLDLEPAIERALAAWPAPASVAALRHRRVPLVAGIAAALIGLVGVGGLLLRSDDRPSGDLVATGGRAADAVAGGGQGSEEAAPGAPHALGAAAQGDLAVDVLVARLQGDGSPATAGGAGGTAGAASAESGPPCRDEAVGVVGATELTVERLVVRGERSVAWIDRTARRLVVMREADCLLVVDRRY